MPFDAERLGIQDVILVRPRAFPDARGRLVETFRNSALLELGIALGVRQENLTVSRRGVLRGIHWQKAPHAQAKLVSVPAGRILDVAVDLRQGSPSFGRWCAAELSSEDHHMLYIPEGFGHAFQVLSDEAVVVYKTNREYAPDFERGLRWDDPSVAVDWPLMPPALSDKDRLWPLLTSADVDPPGTYGG